MRLVMGFHLLSKLHFVLLVKDHVIINCSIFSVILLHNKLTAVVLSSEISLIIFKWYVIVCVSPWHTIGWGPNFALQSKV